MWIRVDSSVCEGHGQCAQVDETLFPLDNDGYSAVGTGAEVPPGRARDAEFGVGVCPVSALRLDRSP
jgi:ferredoxin